ncbi:MAG: carboxypeptidase regulatory-like domain-containing protein [Terracidiphilus sp.]
MSTQKVKTIATRTPNHGRIRETAVRLIMGLAVCFVLADIPARAQTGGQGAIEGTVSDTSGAVVPGAIVTATNTATGVSTTRVTSGAGYYTISPLVPGTYAVAVEAKGFENFKQENMVIDAMQVSGLNVELKPGSATQTVTVSDAPPELDTTSAVLGGTMESSVYMELPLMLAGLQQRDITQFSNLLPGAQVNPGGRSSVISGTAQRLGELYLDGLPMTTASQQGDNRPLFNLVPMEAIDQINVVTSSFSAEYQGAGLENYTMKSGTNELHGTVADFVRNTAFDTWGFSAPWTTIINSQGVKGYQKDLGTKPPEHQNELAAGIGGPIVIPHIINGHNKLFFQANYDRLHSRTAANLVAATIPTTQMQSGDFSQLLSANGGPGYAIYDPSTLASCTAHNGGVPCRYQFGYGAGASTATNNTNPGNPVATGAAVNVIPSNEISPIAQYMEKFLPAPANSAITGNYLGGIPGGYDNYLYSGRIDYVASDKQRISAMTTYGQRANATYATGSTPILPVPYLQGTIAVVAGRTADLEDSYAFTPNLVNQFKYGWVNFGGPPVQNPTQGITQYEAQTAGITGLPAGQASTEFPTSAFSGSNAQSQWSNGASSATYTSVSETLTMIDNLQWIKGRHAITAGMQVQWLQNQASTADGPSTPLMLNWNPAETSGITKGTGYTTGTGYAYASYMMGAVNSSSDTEQTVSELGGRYRPIAPYFQDDFKVTKNLTLNLGMRWDYLPTYHEAQARWSYLDPRVVNPATGNLGTLVFAGNHGAGISSGEATPVHAYWKNWGPRLGFSWQMAPRLVMRGGWGMLYSHAGGTSGAGGAAVGTGQNGFNTPLTFNANSAGATAGPTFYLNNNPAFATPNANYGGAPYTLPTPTGPSAAAQILNVGNYVNSAGAAVAAGSAPGYADFYLAGRAPQFSFFNFGFELQTTKDITLSANYAGSESHFIAGASNIRGLQSGQINPAYVAALGTGSYGAGLLSKPATAANIAAAQAIWPSCCNLPYAGFGAAAATGSSAGNQATIGQMLKWMPQFSSTSDTWGNVANANYHSLQITATKRPSHGLTLTVNYTYSKQMDDAGTQRTGYDIPAALTIDHRAWSKNRIDYSLSTLNEPQSLAVYGVYKLPFGKGGIGGGHLLTRWLLSGWETAHIATYVSGMPLTLSSSNCASLTGEGTCMPDINPNYTGGRKGIRQNGKWGNGVTALTLGTVSYVLGGDPNYNQSINLKNGTTTSYTYVTSPNPGMGGRISTTSATGVVTNVDYPCAATQSPFCNAGIGMVGNAPRTGAFGLRAPDTFRLTSGVNRTFDITERIKFIFRADCQNVTNAVTFGINAANLQIPTNVSSANFGTVGYASGDSRDFQFSGRINF